MVNFHEMKQGDYVIVDFEGQRRRGEVLEVNPGDHKVYVETDVQPFWYEVKDIYPIPLNDEELHSLKFVKETNDDGTVKYKKGPFRIMLERAGDFSDFEMWYREDLRQHPNVHAVHQLQNHYYDMTKVHLTKEVMV